RRSPTTSPRPESLTEAPAVTQDRHWRRRSIHPFRSLLETQVCRPSTSATSNRRRAFRAVPEPACPEPGGVCVHPAALAVDPDAVTDAHRRQRSDSSHVAATLAKDDLDDHLSLNPPIWCPGRAGEGVGGR